jgi:hypothetical protein
MKNTSMSRAAGLDKRYYEGLVTICGYEVSTEIAKAKDVRARSLCTRRRGRIDVKEIQL